MGEEQIGGSYSLSDLGGLLILGKNGEIYASGWDEQPVRPDMIMLPSRQEEKEEKSRLSEEETYEDKAADSDTLQISPEEDGVTDTEPDSGAAPVESERENSEIPGGSAYQEESGETEKIPEESPAQEEIPEADPEYGERVRESPDTVRIADEAVMESQSAAPQEAFIPFFDEEITDCQKVTPADLRILGRRDRGLMNNNFLRYGMKNYGHLLLGKRREDGRYILGVPGIMNGRKALWPICSVFPILKSAQAPGKGGDGSDTGTGLSTPPRFEKLLLTCNQPGDIINLVLPMQDEIRRCTQVVVRGRTRNAIGPQGRVGSTPTISVRL